MESLDYDRACNLLEQITMTPETEAMWQNLSQIALDQGRLQIAERCFAALGDVAKTQSLNRINTLAEEAKAEHVRSYNNDMYDGYGHYTVRAEIHMLNKEFKAAEKVLLEQGKVDEAMAMWDNLMKFDESIHVAETNNHPNVSVLISLPSPPSYICLA